MSRSCLISLNTQSLKCDVFFSCDCNTSLYRLFLALYFRSTFLNCAVQNWWFNAACGATCCHFKRQIYRKLTPYELAMLCLIRTHVVLTQNIINNARLQEVPWLCGHWGKENWREGNYPPLKLGHFKKTPLTSSCSNLNRRQCRKLIQIGLKTWRV